MPACILSDEQATNRGTTQPPAERSVVRGGVMALLWAAAIVATLCHDQPLESLWDDVGDGVPGLWFAATILTGVVNAPCIALAIVLIALLDRRAGWRLVWRGAGVMAGQAVACEVAKHLFGRLRPDVSLGATILQGPSLHGSGFSFPSGHATAAFALAALLAAFYPRWRWLFVAVAASVCLARVQLDRHFPSDVLAGGVLGWYVAVLALRLIGNARRGERTSLRRAGNATQRP